MSESFFALWGTGFWLLMIITSIIFIFGCEKNSVGLSVISSIILVIVYHSYLTVFLLNPAMFVIVFFGWIILGVFWSLWRWFRYCKKIVSECNRQNIGVSTDQLDLYDNKSRIINWIVYWPWDLLWNLTGEFIQHVWDAMENVYKRIMLRSLNDAKSFKNHN